MEGRIILPKDDPAASFEPHRARLRRIAYRMLGSFSEAEDVVQDAYLRWHGSDRASVREPGAFLSRIATRLALDRLKSARATRETYIGPWLPEPMVGPEEPDGPDDDLTVTLMLALERLSPLERAAFLLHDIFGLGFAEIAATLEKGEAACRQLASRARSHVRAGRPRFPVAKEEGVRIAEAFFEASRSGDAEGLRRLLADGVVAYTDGGGIRPAALNPILGAENVAAMFLGLARKAGFAGSRLLATRRIDGLAGFVSVEKDGIPQTTAFEIEAGRITAIYVVRNPEKLRHVDG